MGKEKAKNSNENIEKELGKETYSTYRLKYGVWCWYRNSQTSELRVIGWGMG